MNETPLKIFRADGSATRKISPVACPGSPATCADEVGAPGDDARIASTSMPSDQERKRRDDFRVPGAGRIISRPTCAACAMNNRVSLWTFDAAVASSPARGDPKRCRPH
jgi:hypothetical protein